jgi:hypothetical protein
MELSLQLDTLGLIEIQYLRARERYRDWPPFQLFAASRQARVFAFMSREVAEQLHQQILVIEAAIGRGIEDEEEDEEEEETPPASEESETDANPRATERDSSAFSPALASALKQLNELARQRLGDASSSSSSQSSSGPLNEMAADVEAEDALEQLQEAFSQMMEVVRELAEEMATDALKITGRFKCARTNIEFVPRPTLSPNDEEETDDDNEEHITQQIALGQEEGLINIQLELVMVLQLFEEGRTRQDDPPAVELQLDVDDFERLHETLDYALERDRRSSRRRR